MLFDMGCGFTEFLSNVFAHLPLPQVGFHLQYLFSDLIISESQIKTIGQVLQCRLVCSTWRDFIDMEVSKPNPFLRQSHNEQDFVETISQRTRLLPRLSSGTQTPWESDCGELGLWIIVCSTVVARCSQYKDGDASQDMGWIQDWQRSLRGNLTSSFQVATVASDSGRVYAAMKHGEVCQVGLMSQYKVCLHCENWICRFWFLMVALFFWRLCWRVAKSLCGRYY